MKLTFAVILTWEERFYIPPPPGSNFRDYKCARIETKASVHHPPLGGGGGGCGGGGAVVVVVAAVVVLLLLLYKTALPITVSRLVPGPFFFSIS